MQTRALGATGRTVSRLGIGTWGLGGDLWRDASLDEAQRTLFDAVENGVTLIDTALIYGRGESEKRVGQVVRELRARDTVTVASKIPPADSRWPPAADSELSKVFPTDYVVRSVEDSLRNLKLDAVPLMQFHVWRDEWLDQEAWPLMRKTMASLVKAGKVLHWGLSANDHAPDTCLRAVAEPEIQSVQVIYNLFDQSAQDALFPTAMENDVAIIARCPFDEGALTGAVTRNSTFAVSDFRSGYFTTDRLEQLEPRVGALRALLGEHAQTLPELALRFCLAADAVTAVIPGTRRAPHLEANLVAAAGPPLPPDFLVELAGIAWERNWY